MTSTTPNTPANGGQILTDERIMEIAAEQDYGDEDPKCIKRLVRAIEADLRAALATPAIPTVDRNAAPLAQELFVGDDAALCESIHALLAMDQAGILVPHGVGGHARTLLATAALRLAAGVTQPAVQVVAPDLNKLTRYRCGVGSTMLSAPSGNYFRISDVQEFLRATPATDKTAEESDTQQEKK